MANLNDERILTLKKVIAEKKEKLGKIARFVPNTNCQINLKGVTQNINVLSKVQLVALKVELNMYKISAKDLGLEKEFTISGYKVDEWMEDVQQRLDIIGQKDEEQKLKSAEAQLSKLLSEDKKVELEIDAIADLLKE